MNHRFIDFWLSVGIFFFGPIPSTAWFLKPLWDRHQWHCERPLGHPPCNRYRSGCIWFITFFHYQDWVVQIMSLWWFDLLLLYFLFNKKPTVWWVGCKWLFMSYSKCPIFSINLAIWLTESNTLDACASTSSQLYSKEKWADSIMSS